jgi:hypothetical protein
MATPDAQLQAMCQLGENWDGYGAAAPQAHVIELAREFVSLIAIVLRTRAAAPEAPHVSPTRTGGILIEWEAAELQHEVEISPDQSFAFLHFNKATGHTDAGHAEIQSGLSSLDDHACRKKLSLLFRFVQSP